MTGSPLLLPLVQTLASLETSGPLTSEAIRQQNAASRQLLALLRQRGARLVPALAPRLSADDIEDIVQHVATQASTGTARCKAQLEAEAWGWCKTVARNYALDLLKQRSRERATEDPYAGAEPQVASPDSEQQVWHETDQVVQQALDAVRSSSRGDDKATSVACAAEYFFGGASIEQQIARWGFPDGAPTRPSQTDLTRARNRVYAYRSRGAAYLEAMLDTLEQQGDLSPADTALVRRLIQQRSRKKKPPVR